MTTLASSVSREVTLTFKGREKVALACIAALAFKGLGGVTLSRAREFWFSGAALAPAGSGSIQESRRYLGGQRCLWRYLGQQRYFQLLLESRR